MSEFAPDPLSRTDVLPAPSERTLLRPEAQTQLVVRALTGASLEVGGGGGRIAAAEPSVASPQRSLVSSSLLKAGGARGDRGSGR
jgi:hypothetical protein